MIEFSVKHPPPAVMVFDDFLGNPHEIRGEALATKKMRSGRHKGERSVEFPIPPTVASFLEETLRLRGGVRGYSCFQLCLAGDQLVYHSDAQRWAAVIFLTPDAPPETGSSFFASRALPHTRSSAHIVNGAHERLVYGNKLLDRTAWIEVDRVGNVFNRLVIWDARLIHSASEYFGSAADDGRLFMMAFFDEG